MEHLHNIKHFLKKSNKSFMDRILYIIFFILLFYIIYHLVYTVYALINMPVSGVLWLIGLLIEIIVIYLGYKKNKFLLFVFTLFLILNSVYSIFILCNSVDMNTKNADYTIVLGYQLDDNQMTKTLEYRLEKAYSYAKNNENTKLVLCGGIVGSNSKSEADVMYDYLVSKGIDESRLIKEDQSTDTIENIKNALGYIDADSSIVLISSNYHCYRAKMICKNVGLEVKTIGAKAPLALYPNQLLFEKLGLIKTLFM